MRRRAAAGLALTMAVALAVALIQLSRADRPAGTSRADARAMALDLTRTRALGRGRAYQLGPRGTRVAAGLPVDGLRCTSPTAPHYGAHVELFADDRVLLLPAGIGWAAPVRMSAGRVRNGRCAYPLRTDEPTGLVLVAPTRGRAPTVGALFALWGQRLDRRRLAGFASRRPLRAFLNGQPWSGDPRQIALAPHARVELELGPAVAPHPTYAFPPGL